jgi:TolB-like protein/Tfp pilus assembly protein PilF
MTARSALDRPELLFRHLESCDAERSESSICTESRSRRDWSDPKVNEFFQRLRQRKLVQWAVAYVAGAFALLQAIDIVAQQFAWPGGVQRGITLALVLGFFVTLVLAWYHGERGAQRVSGAELLILSLVLAAGGGVLWRYARTSHVSEQPFGAASREISPAPPVASIPEKSIAVLPFENLSSDPDNAYFAEGIQNEILTRLSKVADLKVISRTSTEHYKAAPENLRAIAQQLGVAHVVEGSVQRKGDKVRVDVELINAANDSQLWAEIFDRKLTDIFAVESEIAKTIADQLRAHLSGQEQKVIAAKPTGNTEAYDAYLRGLAYTLKTGGITPAKSLGAQKYLREAVRLDPKFALAWALLSYVDAVGYITQSLQPTAELREETRTAAETALTLQPDLGEALMAKGYYYYGCLKDCVSAVHYFDQASRFLPNNSRIPESLAYVARRQGQWGISEFYFKEAERLDPRDANLLTQHALSYFIVRDFSAARKKLEQILNITPDDLDTLALKAMLPQAEGDLETASAILGPLRPTADDPFAIEAQVYQAILERQSAAIVVRVREILTKPHPASGYFDGELRFWLGWGEEIAGDKAAAKKSWEEARRELEALLAKQPKNFALLEDLALTNMKLGDKAAAFEMCERAEKANPTATDAMYGPFATEILARVAAGTNEPGQAINALAKLRSVPYRGPLVWVRPLTPALLRLDPMFDPLRSDPRFQGLLTKDGAETKDAGR